MKKLFLMAAFVVASVAASAQVYVGGGIGFQSSKADTDGAKAATSFSITPEIGYHLDDNWAVGIGLGYSHAKSSSEVKTDAFTIEPYARYTFAKWNNVGLFVDGVVGYTNKTVKEDGEDDVKTNTFNIGLRPGLSISLNDKLNFVTTVGFLGYKNTDYDAYKVNSYGFDFDLSNINFALYYNF